MKLLPSPTKPRYSQEHSALRPEESIYAAGYLVSRHTETIPVAGTFVHGRCILFRVFALPAVIP